MLVGRKPDVPRLSIGRPDPDGVGGRDPGVGDIVRDVVFDPRTLEGRGIPRGEGGGMLPLRVGEKLAGDEADAGKEEGGGGEERGTGTPARRR